MLLVLENLIGSDSVSFQDTLGFTGVSNAHLQVGKIDRVFLCSESQRGNLIGCISWMGLLWYHSRLQFGSRSILSKSGVSSPFVGEVVASAKRVGKRKPGLHSSKHPSVTILPLLSLFSLPITLFAHLPDGTNESAFQELAIGAGSAMVDLLR
jgi:hypothetical protein